jgi:hypothetical protein
VLCRDRHPGLLVCACDGTASTQPGGRRLPCEPTSPVQQVRGRRGNAKRRRDSENGGHGKELQQPRMA